jgi:hypothetical protein
MRSLCPISCQPPTWAQAGAKKTTNMSKTAAVIQKPEESPTDFYASLCEAFQVYTPFNPEMLENQWIVNTVFVAQSYIDICQKLQKLEGFAGMNTIQSLEVANKLCVNGEREEK